MPTVEILALPVKTKSVTDLNFCVLDEKLYKTAILYH